MMFGYSTKFFIYTATIVSIYYNSFLYVSLFYVIPKYAEFVPYAALGLMLLLQNNHLQFEYNSKKSESICKLFSFSLIPLSLVYFYPFPNTLWLCLTCSIFIQTMIYKYNLKNFKFYDKYILFYIVFIFLKIINFICNTPSNHHFASTIAASIMLTNEILLYKMYYRKPH